MIHWDHPSGDGRKLRVGACKRDPPGVSAPRYEAARWKAHELPPLVDLRAHLTPVEDQGEVGSCSANALAGALEYLERRIAGTEGRASRLFIYWNERKAEGAADQDQGAALSDGIRVLKSAGACSEETWGYDPKRVFHEPPRHAYDEAKAHTIDSAHRVAIALHDMRHCLAEGYPFVFGLSLYQPFALTKSDGKVALPDPHKDKACGGHAMLAVGYSDKDRVFVVRNSWSARWGDRGYCYIPYGYLANERYCADAWTIRKAHDLDFAQVEGHPDAQKRRPGSLFAK